MGSAIEARRGNRTRGQLSVLSHAPVFVPDSLLVLVELLQIIDRHVLAEEGRKQSQLRPRSSDTSFSPRAR